MLYHAIVMGVMPDGSLVAETGWMGVDLFFALSGFLIGGQLFRPFVRGDIDGRPFPAVLVYGGTAVAAGALLYAVAERPALLARDRILGRLGATTFVPKASPAIEPAAEAG